METKFFNTFWQADYKYISKIFNMLEFSNMGTKFWDKKSIFKFYWLKLAYIYIYFTISVSFCFYMKRVSGVYILLYIVQF